MEIKWGIYRFYNMKGELTGENIHTDDWEKIKLNFFPLVTNIYQFIKTEEEYNILIMNGEKIRVKDEIIRELSEPKFKIGESVYIHEKEIFGMVWTYFWHSKKEKYFYYLYVNGKKKSKRYFDDDLKKV